MHQEQVPIPGARDVTATLDEPDDGAAAVVVACPPHPQLGGHRGDRRLTAVSEALVDEGVACLRFDYGEWDEGYGEREDARNALRWAADRFDRVGLFGFSFGGGVAALAAATTEVPLHAVALLAPASRLTADLDAVAAFDSISAPVQVVYGTRDETADWAPLVERARECEQAVVEMSADHHFVGQEEKVGTTVATFLARNLR
ncbi:CocE/NonD family hydrolase [Halobacteriaceae archaeon GCM10025711]